MQVISSQGLKTTVNRPWSIMKQCQ